MPYFAFGATVTAGPVWPLSDFAVAVAEGVAVAVAVARCPRLGHQTSSGPPGRWWRWSAAAATRSPRHRLYSPRRQAPASPVLPVRARRCRWRGGNVKNQPESTCKAASGTAPAPGLRATASLVPSVSCGYVRLAGTGHQVLLNHLSRHGDVVEPAAAERALHGNDLIA
jgi:hypothetical protein